MQQTRVLRPLGLMEIVDHSFRLYRANFWLFFGIVATLHLPLSCLQGAVMGKFMGLAETPGTPTLAQFIPLIIGGALFVLALIFVTLMIRGASTRAVSDVYMGEPTGLGKSYLHVLRRFPAFLGTAFAVVLVTFCGFIPAAGAFAAQSWVLGAILCVPGIAVAIWASFACALAVEAFIIEDQRYFSAISRSIFLIKQGVWAEWLVLNLLIGIITAVATVPISMVLSIASVVGSIPPSWQFGISSVGNGIASAFFMPLQYIAIVLLYYNSRMRKEGFDLEVLAREMGTTPPAAAWQPTASSQVTWQPQPAVDMTTPPSPQPDAAPMPAADPPAAPADEGPG